MSRQTGPNKLSRQALVFLAAIFIVVCVGASDLRRANGQPAPPPALTATPTPTPGACLPATTTQYESMQIVYQQFPSKGPAETAWIVQWFENGHKGLWIQGAWFWRKKPFTAGTLIQVLGQSGLSDIFVPYHNPIPAMPNSGRLHDLGAGYLHAAIPQDAGDCGAIADPAIPWPGSQPAGSQPTRRVLVKEIRDRGVAWTSDRQTRRGEEMLLWATYDAGNYEYIMQYGFRDDGTITFRLGSTGYNSPFMPFEPHMHNALWYVDINLADGQHNTVRLMRHIEPTDPGPAPPCSTNSPDPNLASDCMPPFYNEGPVYWNDKEFTGLNIISTTVKNAQGNNIGYDFMPMRMGTARHAEYYTQHDFWVTVAKQNEREYQFVGTYADGEPVMDADVAIWYMSSNHHHPRDEDHEYGQSVRVPGVALVMWSGFDLQPRNLFDDTPLHEPSCAPIPPNLVGWWPFEDGVGATTVADATPNSTAPLNGSPHPAGAAGPSTVPGVVNGALSFDGVNDYVEFPDSPALNFGTGDFSIDAWIKTTQNPNDTNVHSVLDKRQLNPLQGYHLFTYGGKLFLQLASGGGYNNYPSDAYVGDGNWHHVTVAVNRTSQPYTVKWYVDGIDMSDYNHTTPLTPSAGSLNNSSPLRLGVRSFSLGAYWSGALDELEIFNRALGQEEAFAIFAAGRKGKCP